jgi:membrane protein required for colicin V production
MSSISLHQLNWADFAIVAIIVFSALISLARGFVREAISLVTWLVAVLVALRFSNALAEFFVPYVHTASFRTVIAFAILLIAVLIVGGLINYLFSQLVDKMGFSGTDRILGFVFGAARGLLFIGVLVLLGNMANVNQAPWWNGSQLIPQFQGLAQWLQRFVPTEVNHISQADVDTR